MHLVMHLANGFLPRPVTAALAVSTQLARLNWIDVLVIAIYFAIVVFIGFYLRGSSNTSEEFFMAGREMTAWIAGLSFVSANLGSLELMGWAGSAYQYGILAMHWYWIGAIPAMLFLGIVMMPFYYISKTHSVPGYLKLRYGDGARALSAVSFAFMTILMSGINMYSMAIVMKVVLGWDLNFSIWVSSVTVAVYVALGGLKSAIYNEILQFLLIWAGALLIPILGLIEVGRLDQPAAADRDQPGPLRLCSLVVDAGPLQHQSHGGELVRDRLRVGLRGEFWLLDHRLSGGPARPVGR